MPFPPYPSIPAPITHVKGEHVDAAQLRSDCWNALLLLTQPPVFSGAQTGLPVPYTAASSTDLFTAPETAYTTGQPVILAITSGTGGFTSGTVYYVTNPNVDTFQLSATLGGSVQSISSAGTGTIQMTQVIAATTWTGVTLDTQVSDPWNGHLTTSNPSQYFGMLNGVYLAEFTFPPNFTGSGTVSAGIIAQEGTAAPVTIGGARMPNSGTGGRFPQVNAVKLLVFSSTGYGTGNWVQGAVYQEAGQPITSLSTSTRYPQLNLEWVAALSGDATLPVPDNDAWPIAPGILTATFLNKNVRDCVSYLAYRPVMEAVYSAGSFALTAQGSLPATGQAIPLDTVHVDTYGAFNPSTHIWTCLRPGVHDVYAQMSSVNATTSTSVAAGITVTSTNYNSGSTYTVWGPAQVACTGVGPINSAIVRRRFRLTYGDQLKLAAFQSDSSSASATCPGGTWKSRLITVWRAA